MSFIESYILFGLISIVGLTTFCLQDLYKERHEKIGLVFVWISIFLSIMPGFNKLHLVWLAPLAFIIPYYFLKITGRYSRKFFGTILSITSFSAILAGIAFLWR